MGPSLMSTNVGMPMSLAILGYEGLSSLSPTNSWMSLMQSGFTNILQFLVSVNFGMVIGDSLFRNIFAWAATA